MPGGTGTSSGGKGRKALSVRNAAKKQIITGLALICGYIGSMAVSKMLGGMPLFGAFLFTACAMIPAGLLMAAAAGRTGGTDQENVQAVRSVRAYRALNRVSTPVMAAAALTANALFALLGIRREWIGSAMAAGILCSAAAAGLGACCCGDWNGRNSGTPPG